MKNLTADDTYTFEIKKNLFKINFQDNNNFQIIINIDIFFFFFNRLAYVRDVCMNDGMGTGRSTKLRDRLPQR